MKKATQKPNKCLIWDLDGTVWDGILIEDENVKLKKNISQILQTLDQRGILQSIASKNEHKLAMNKLVEFGLDKYFIYPQINWNSKADSVKKIAESINIGLDTMAFIDDQAYERDEVNFSLPEVLCLDASETDGILDMAVFQPKFITKDSSIRRQMYQSDIKRNEVEGDFHGPKEDFLKSLKMELSIFDAKEEDLQRAEELTVRTNQLNATGYTYSYEELKEFIYSDKYQLIMTRLTDKYGTYGHIGLSLIERREDLWIIKLLLMSCRVTARGIGSIMLTYIMNLAKEEGVGLHAEFVETDRNRLMNITYRLAGFYNLETKDGVTTLTNDLNEERHMPDYLTVNVTSHSKYKGLEKSI